MSKLAPFGWSTTLRSPAEMFGFCQKVAEFLRAVSQLELLRGQVVEATFTAATSGVVRHQLGRPYKGALVLAQADQSQSVRVDYADEALPPIDPAQSVKVAFSGAYTGRLKLWVF